MKSASILLLLFVFSNVVFGQNIKIIKAIKVKETPVIDTFVDSYYNQYPISRRGDNSDIFIEIISKNNQSCFIRYFIDSIYKKQVYTKHAEILQAQNFRYFKYHSRYVIIYNDEDTYGFFQKTSKRKSFIIKLLDGKGKFDMGPSLFVYQKPAIVPVVPFVAR